MHWNNKKEIAASFAYMLGLFGLIALAFTLSNSPPPVIADTPQPEQINPTSQILEAKSATVYDIATDRFLFEKNAELQLPLASITKLMTAYVAATSSHPTEVAIPAEALKEEGDSGLFANEKWNLADLIGFTLVTSSNDGAAAIAQALGPENQFVSLMNDIARSLGLAQTYFRNPTGLDISVSESGGYSSAHDVAKLLTHILKEEPDLVEKTQLPSLSVKSLSGFVHEVKNTNKSIAGELGVFASKTGFTDLAGGNLAVAFDAGPSRPMIAVVLGSSLEGRFADIHSLITSTLDFVQRNE